MRKRYVVGFVILLAIAALPSFIQIIQDALLWRTQMIPLRRIQQAAARNGTQKAAVLIGDSLVESATFSSTLCGLPVVNAGLAGSRASDVLLLLDEMSRIGISPALIVISVGINNAIDPDRRAFTETYPEIIRRAQALAGKVFVVTLAPIADSGSIADVVDRTQLPDIRQTIRQTAQDHSVPIIDVSALDAQDRPWIEDGVHLGPDGYVRWIGAIESVVSRWCP
jgi:lysophospholipase L1-like esterase